MSAPENTFAPPPAKRPDVGGRVATTGSLLGALAMTSCCILPLVLVSLGVGGVWIAQLTALYAYKWITFSIAAAFIGWGFWKAYRPAECREGAACARPVNKTIMRASLWFATFVVLVALIFPYITPYILSF